MTKGRKGEGRGLCIREAGIDDLPAITALLTAAATALIRKGEALWNLSTLTETALRRDVRAGRYVIALDDDGPAAVFRFQLEDPDFWPEIAPGSSAFVHKLAVHPRRQGQDLAQVLLAHACERARQAGRQHLRLDCMAGRPKLAAVYERFGFRLHSEIALGGNTFRRYEIAIV